MIEDPTTKDIIDHVPSECHGGGSDNVVRTPKDRDVVYKYHVTGWTRPEYNEYGKPVLDETGKQLVVPIRTAEFMVVLPGAVQKRRVQMWVAKQSA